MKINIREVESQGYSVPYNILFSLSWYTQMISYDNYGETTIWQQTIFGKANLNNQRNF